MPLIPSDITKNKRSQYQKFLDVAPTGTNPTWKVIGIGISEASVDYGPQINTEQWIIEDSARNDHTGNQKTLPVTQRCYKGDPEFEYINDCRDKLNCTSHILEVDTWNGTGTTTVSYPAKMSDCLITVTSYSGEEIEYTIYFNGDPANGTVTIADGVPTFTPTVA